MSKKADNSKTVIPQMSLIDYFAGQVVGAIAQSVFISAKKRVARGCEDADGLLADLYPMIATEAYELANAMLKEREDWEAAP